MTFQQGTISSLTAQFFGEGCLVHWLALLGMAVSLAYLALRFCGTRPLREGEGLQLPLGDGCFLLFLAGVAAILYSARRCGLDGGLLTVWMGLLVAEMGLLTCRREQDWTF